MRARGGRVNLLVIIIIAFLLRLAIPTAALNQQAVWKQQLEMFQVMRHLITDSSYEAHSQRLKQYSMNDISPKALVILRNTCLVVVINVYFFKFCRRGQQYLTW